MDAADAEWEAEHAYDMVDSVRSMNKKDKLRYFGGKKNDGAAKAALVDSGVIDTDRKLDSMWKTDSSGKKSMKSLQELAEDGIFTVDDTRLKHSVIGDYVKASKQYPAGRMKNGGHSQAAMDRCDTLGIEYSVQKEFSNGVRIGNVPSSSVPAKKNGNGQAWFPETWDGDKIRIAGTYAANKGVQLDEIRKVGVYDGVAVRVLMTDARVATVCPDLDQDIYVKGVKVNE